MAQRAVFLDRDGTLIEDSGYARDPARVRLLPGAGEALAELRDDGFLLIVVSNQSGIGRGLITSQEAESVHRKMEELLAAVPVRLDAAYYCPHLPDDDCPCRKPRPGLFLRAVGEMAIDLRRSFMVGDRWTDAESGRRAGCWPILLGSASDQVRSDVDVDIAKDWSDVVARIIGQR